MCPVCLAFFWQASITRFVNVSKGVANCAEQVWCCFLVRWVFLSDMFGGFFWHESTMCFFLMCFLAGLLVSKVLLGDFLICEVFLGLLRHFHGVYKLFSWMFF